MQYDSYKVQAILNEIDGYNHSRTTRVGVPGIFGMNFQTISTAQKLPTSDGLTGGYLPGGMVPGPLLVRALNYLDSEIGAMVSEIGKQGLAGGTAIIISAKHGQSPTDPGALARVPDAPIIASTRPGPRRIRAPASWSSSPPTMTGCCCGSPTARRPRPTSRNQHQRAGRDNTDRPDHPAPARPEPQRPAGGPDRAHRRASGPVN
jgi:hypothetical protein